jgi:hypothetical protein
MRVFVQMCSSARTPISPIARLAAQVHYGMDDDLLRLDSVQQTEGELAKEFPAEALA